MGAYGCRHEWALAGLDACHCGSRITQLAFARLEADITRREMLGGMAAVVGLFAGFGLATEPSKRGPDKRPLLLTHLRYFDGLDLRLQEGRDVLVEGGRITALPAVGQGPEDAQVIDCGGRVLIPGLIDTHAHLTLAGVREQVALMGDINLVHLIAGQTAGRILMQGFTSVRDAGGPVFGLKQAIDQGVLPGPRVFPSGAMLSQTSGHGDFRLLRELPRGAGTPPAQFEVAGVGLLADGVAEVLRGTREQLMKGASQIKIMAGGGVSSPYDPLDSLQYTLSEMRAAVEAAADWGTYVCAHVYTSAGIRRCVEAGVRSIEHGQLADEETVKLMADAGVWWSIQPFLDDEDANPKPDPKQRAKQLEVSAGTERAFELGRKYPVPMSFGTDALFNPTTANEGMGRQLAKIARFMPPLEALRLATGRAGELLALSGSRAPYDGPLGVIAEGAAADLLLIDGDPTQTLDWLTDPDTHLRLILKAGHPHKNTL